MRMELPGVMLFFGASRVSDRAARRFAKLQPLRPITARQGQRAPSASIALEDDMLENRTEQRQGRSKFRKVQ
jgi:hypothetical protein